MKLTAFFILLSLFATRSFATNSLVVSGKLLDPNGIPVTGNSIAFTVSVLDPTAAACVLHTESFTLDMSNSQGLFELKLGTGTSVGPYALKNSFYNGNSFSGLSCTSGTTYAPGSTDGRKIKISFNDGASHSLPPIDISSVPYAFTADAIGGFDVNGLVRVSDSGTTGNIAPISTSGFNELVALINGTSSQYTKAGQLNGVSLPTLSNGSVLGWNGSSWSAVTPVTTESDPTVQSFAKTALPTCAAGEVLKGNGSVLSCVTAGLSNVGTPGTYTKVTTDVSGRVTAGASLTESDIPALTTAGKVSGNALTSGTIGGSTSLVTSGNVSVASVAAPSYRVYENTATRYVELRAPSALSANYSLNFPSGAPAAGQTLTSDAAGNLSWNSPSTVPSGTAGGDLAGTYPAPTVAKINGVNVNYASLSGGHFLKYNGTNWVNAALTSANLTNDSDLLKASSMPASCSSSQTLTFSSPTGTWICSSITVDAGAIASGTIATARLPAGATAWQVNGSAVAYSAGNVGVGTTTPAFNVDIQGSDLAYGLRVMNTSSSAQHFPGINVTNYTGNYQGEADLNLVTARGSYATPAAVQGGDFLGAVIGWGQYGTSSGQFGKGGYIAFAADGAYNSTSYPTSIGFYTTPNGSTTPAQSMIIAGSGKVGVGTGPTSAKLAVGGVVESTSGGFKFPDGSTQTTAAGTGNMVVFISSGTWTVPISVGKVKVTVIGGGGGGAGGTMNSSGGGGGGSGAVTSGYQTVTPGGSVSIVVGVGGSGGAAGGGSASSGSYSSFGSIVANGGGAGATNGIGGGPGTTSSSLALNISGQVGGSSFPAPGNLFAGGAGASSFNGWGIGGPGSNSATVSASVGVGFGAGGGGGGANISGGSAGGNGSGGAVIIEY